jgi:saccharopine dehydrogenase-like NADP-dependent oxidoreductase
VLGAVCEGHGAGALSRILILGGYGGFGARLSRRLAALGHQVLVAGRNPYKAKAFCAAHPGTVPLVADRNADLYPVLAAVRPDVVIDAAGPFQDSSYAVPRACARARASYIDLADARAFVTGIGALDVVAIGARVSIVAGASSVPALSGAVARRLADGLDLVRTVDIAISASNRATAGRSIARAILSYVGRPVQLWRGRRWAHCWGWQELRRETFSVAGARDLRNRWVAIADVPDHELLVDALPGRPAVTFRAGTESAVQTIGLWLLSWPVRWLSLGGLELLAPLLLPLQRLSRRLSDGRSGMMVRIKGEVRGTFVERQWTLIADNGDGPEVPTLAAVLMVEAMAGETVGRGARDAGSLLDLDAFEPLFASLAIRHAISGRSLPPPLYARVMGNRFDKLPAAVRAMHRVCGDAGASGEATVERGGNAAARLIASVMGFPRAGTHPLHVSFIERDSVETWTRTFGDRSFTSHLSEHKGRLVERFGPLRFQFELPSDARGLEMRMVGWSCFGVPLPLAVAPRSIAREWEEDGRFHFDVPIALPLVGMVVHYRGWLVVD